MVFASSKDWIFRPYFAADTGAYLNANLCYPCEVKSNRKIVTVIDLPVLEGNSVLKSSGCSEGRTVIFAVDRRIQKTHLYCH